MFVLLRRRSGAAHSARTFGAPSGRARAVLLIVGFAGSCAVYEPITASVAGASGDSGLDGPAGGTESSGTEAPPISVEAGQAAASEGGSRGSPFISEDTEGGNGSAQGGAANGGAPAGSETGGEAAFAGSGGDASGGTGSTTGAGGTGSTSCIAGWRGRNECDACIAQRQPDLQACAVILDCYADKGCGPSSCAYPDGKCGTNVLGLGAAAYQIAQDVYSCVCK